MSTPKKRPQPKPAAKPKPKQSKQNPADPPTYQPGSDPLAVVPTSVTSIVPALSGWAPTPAAFDVALAEAYERDYAARLEAIAPNRIRILRLDADAVCGTALTVHSLTQAPAILARYEAAAEAGEFLLDNLDHLRALPFIVLDARRRAAAAGAFATNAKLPTAVEQESAQVEARMEKVCEHLYWDDPELGPLVQALHPGKSYLDRAYDLLGYADIYDQRRDAVSSDPVHYRATDAADARRLAGQILATLSATMSPQARKWYDMMQRAWTLLEVVYDEVREMGLRFLRSDPLREQRLPSLYVVGRASTGRKKAKKADGAGKPATEAKGSAKADGEAKTGSEPKTEAKADAKTDGSAAASDAKPADTKAAKPADAKTDPEK